MNKPHKYEAMFLLNGSRLADSGGSAVGRVQDLLTKHGVTPVRVDIWDERRLAYPIDKQKRGTYVLSHFEAPGDTISVLQRDVNINEDIMRVLFVRHEKDFPEFKTAAEMDVGRSGRRDDEDRGEEGERRGRRTREAPILDDEDVDDDI